MFKLSSSAGTPAPAPALAPTSATPPPPASPNLDPNTGLPITSTPGLAWVQPPPAPVPAEYPGSGPVCPGDPSRTAPAQIVVHTCVRQFD